MHEPRRFLPFPGPRRPDRLRETTPPIANLRAAESRAYSRGLLALEAKECKLAQRFWRILVEYDQRRQVHAAASPRYPSMASEHHWRANSSNEPQKEVNSAPNGSASWLVSVLRLGSLTLLDKGITCTSRFSAAKTPEPP